jgi:hypothetical protein
MCHFFKYWTVHSELSKVSGGEIMLSEPPNANETEIIAKKMNDDSFLWSI